MATRLSGGAEFANQARIKSRIIAGGECLFCDVVTAGRKVAALGAYGVKFRVSRRTVLPT